MAATRVLNPGRYTLVITAMNAAGQRSAPKTLTSPSPNPDSPTAYCVFLMARGARWAARTKRRSLGREGLTAT